MQREGCKKLGLLGGAGVGKDTFVQIVRTHFSHLNIQLIRLADPLYAVQKYVYEACGKEKEEHIQDGELLNFLGSHMRKINPDVLKEPFERAVKEIVSSMDLVICSDVRPKDVGFVREQGFHIVHISTDPKIALQRREKRGDLTLGCSLHSTEMGVERSLFDTEIINNNTLEEFEEAVLKFIGKKL